MSLVLSNLGDVSETLGKYAAAHEHYLNALCMAIEIGSAPSMLTYVVKIGILLTKTGTHERAAELLGLSIAHGATEQAFKDRAQRALDELSAYLSPQVMAAAHARGEVRSLEDVARELVATDANWMQGFVEHNL